MLAGVTDCRRSQKWGCRGRLALGFKPRHGSLEREDHVVLKEKREDHEVLGERKEDHVVLECSFLSCSLGSRRDFARKKRGDRTLVGGP